ncbi:hypothetical protein [Niallia sp. Krafla_26]|uniref:hypothetical protein n=1 Tax=Niallia sp. Krafla_26 TaxID=3064703 RepID=UPI003D172E8C
MKNIYKIIIAIGVVLFISVAFIVNANSYSDGVYEQSEKAFFIVENAYKEDRSLTDYELNEMTEFEELRTDRTIRFNRGVASNKEEKDAVLLHAVGQAVDAYKDNSVEFSKKYETAKMLLDR